MQYAPTHIDQKFDSTLLDESETCQVFGCMSLRPTTPRRVTLKNCMDARKTRRELDGCDQCYANLDEQPLKIVLMYANSAGDLTDMAIFTQNPAGIGRIWLYSLKTRRGLEGYGHFH